MKKTFILLTLITSVSLTKAQQWYGSSTINNNIYRSGDISVYYNSPFQVTLGAAWGGSQIGYGTGYLGFNLSRNNHSDGLWVYSNDGANNGANVIYGDMAGNLLFSNKITSGATSGTIADLDVLNNVKMKLLNSGQLIIGNQSAIVPAGNYKLYVENGILTEMIKVAIKSTADWSDYVFKNNYKPMSLDSLQKYVKRNYHLPDIPSADVMVKEGNDLAKTDARLLQKIEELTIYIIDLNEENKVLKADLEQLKENLKNNDGAILAELQKEIAELKEQIKASTK